MEQIAMPFTPEQVAHLEAHQREGRFHPFTCPERGDGKHGDVDGDKGILVPTVRGWICRYCDYTQDWAHAFMAGPKPALPFTKPDDARVVGEQKPACWFRTKAGELDWGENCVGNHESDVYDGNGEDGYGAIPLYARPADVTSEVPQHPCNFRGDGGLMCDNVAECDKLQRCQYEEPHS